MSFADEEVEMESSEERKSFLNSPETERKVEFWNTYLFLHWVGTFIFGAVFIVYIAMAFSYPVNAHAELTLTRPFYTPLDPNEYVIGSGAIGSMPVKVFMVIPGLAFVYYLVLVFPYGLISKGFLFEGSQYPGKNLVNGYNNILFNMFLHNTCRHGSGMKFLFSSFIWAFTVFLLGVFFRLSDIITNVLNIVLVMVGMAFIWYHEQIVEHKGATCAAIGGEKGIFEIIGANVKNLSPIIIRSNDVLMMKKIGVTLIVLLAESLPHIILIIYFSFLTERSLATIIAFSMMMAYYVICVLGYCVAVGTGWYHNEKTSNYLIMEVLIILAQILLIPGILLAYWVDIRHASQMWTVL